MDVLDVLWVLLCGFMVLDMQAGFLCLETGLARAKNASNIALKNVSDICVATLAFWLFGFGLMFGQTQNGLFGTSLFASGSSTIDFDIAPFLFFQMAFATTAVTIVSGAVAERASFLSYLLVSATVAGVVYPLVGHAAWAGLWIEGQAGWLERLGFLDFAGATVVHSVGGWAALAFCVALGPRRGRFGRKSRRFEPSSMATASLGVIFLWIGWAGFNAGSALAIDAAVGPIVVRTMLGAAAGGACTIALSFLLFRFASAQLTLNGVIAGLVAGTAGVNLYSGIDAVFAGCLGAVAMIAASFLMRVFRVDDVVDAVSVHLAPGVLGTLILPFLVDAETLPAGTLITQLTVQAAGVLATGVWVVTMTALVVYSVGRVTKVRVSPKQEVVGLDVSEHSIGNAFLDLIDEMKRHQRTGQFNSRVTVERSTEVGVLAYRYNKVLDRVEQEISGRIEAMQREKEMREVAENSYTAMKVAQKESARAARQDRLTGLGNRLLLDEMAGTRGEDFEGRLLVVAIDLDRFKAINDRHGHDAGDAVLVETAKRIKSVMRRGVDAAFRIGGDEFVLLVEIQTNAIHPATWCEDLCVQLAEPVAYGHLNLELGASVGFAVNSVRALDLQTLLKQADMALYQAKKTGRGCVVAFSEEIGISYLSHVEELALFKQALERQEIVAHVQTQVDAVTKSVVGCEVLARWQHPHRGLVGPDHFIVLAEELNLVAELDREILDQAIQFYRALRARGAHIDTISVNVSARRLASPSLLEELQNRPDLPTGLAFEILETAHLDGLDIDLKGTVAALKDMGIRIEVDDFGTGHASLASILALEPDTLKIDRMFVSGVAENPARAELVQSLIAIATQFGASTIAEGVETLAEAEVLSRLGADRLQGFAFSKPLPTQDVLERLAPSKSRSA